MDSRNFPQIGTEFLRGNTANSIDTGYIPPEVTSQTTGKATLRGVERNTARGVKQAVVLEDIYPVEYASATDAPEVTPFKVYGEY